MRFYRPLGRIAALTFDLDDTLYDNRPVILRTEQEALAFMQNYHPSLRSFQNVDLQRIRQAVREAEPEIYHDVTRWRHRAIEQAMRDAGLSAQEAIAGANAAIIAIIFTVISEFDEPANIDLFSVILLTHFICSSS